jgi:hypothetical protein
MNKQELRSLIKEEITRILKEAKAETFTFSGVKSFMSFKAIPVFKKHGIDVTKIKKSYDPDSGTTEITVTMDAKTAKKIGSELEKLDTVGERYGGYIQESNIELIGPNIDELLDAITFINTGVKTNKGLRSHSFGKNTLKALDNDGHSIGKGKFSISVQPKTSNESLYIKQVNELLDDHGFECKLYMTK